MSMPYVCAAELLNHSPRRFTPALIDALGGLNRLTIVNPLRLEIETEFLNRRSNPAGACSAGPAV